MVHDVRDNRWIRWGAVLLAGCLPVPGRGAELDDVQKPDRVTVKETYKPKGIVPHPITPFMPIGLNDNGDIVGIGTRPGGQRHAFLLRQGRLFNLWPDHPRDVYVSGINNRGQIFGRSLDNSESGGIHFLYEDGKRREFDRRWHFSAINDRGEVVGWIEEGNPLRPSSIRRRAIRYHNGVLTDLSPLVGVDSTAIGINNRGVIIDETYQPNAEGLFPYLLADGKKTELRLPWKKAYVYGINNSGTVLGGYLTAADEKFQLFLYREGKPVEIGAPPGYDGTSISGSSSFNDAGEVVVTAYKGSPTVGSTTFQAFLYREGRWTKLGTHDGKNSDASGINNRGEVVGMTDASNGIRRLFLYRDGKMTVLPIPKELSKGDRRQELESEARSIGESMWWTGDDHQDLFAETFRLVLPTGEVIARDRLLSSPSKPYSMPWYIEKGVIEGVYTSGDTAVVMGWGLWRPEAAAGSPPEEVTLRPVRYVAVLRKQKGRWFCLSATLTPITGPSSAP